MVFLVSAAVSSSAFTAGSTPYLWRPVIAGGGGFVPGIVYHPTAPGLVYARTDIGGAYRWDNAQGVWIPLTDMLNRNNSDFMGILSIGLDRNDSNRVYLQCGKYIQSWAGTGAVLASTDRGASWSIHPLSVKIGGNEDGRGAGERLQVDPNADSILFMGTTADGLWRSTDFGTTWTKVSTFASSNVNFVLFDPSSGSPGFPTQRIFAGTVNTSAQSLYRSEDGGGTWTLVPGQPNGVMAIRGVVADSLLDLTFANYQGPNGATAGSVWKFGISSGTWRNISPSSGSYGFSGIAAYPRNPNVIIVSTLDRWSPRDEVYMTTDGGSSWSPRLTNGTLDFTYAPYTSGVTPHWLAALAMDPFDSSRAMFGTGYGIWASDNMFSSAPTWHFRDQNLEETVALQIISTPVTYLLSAMGDYDGFRHDNLQVSPPNRFSPPKGTTLSIAFAGSVPSKIVKAFNATPFGALSTDGGTSWRNFGGRGATGYPAGTTAGGSWAIAVAADGGNMVWGPGGASMSFSTDNGTTWSACGGGVPLVPPVADRVNPSKFYAYDGVNGQLWVSTDGGRTFAKGAGGLPTVGNAEDGNVTAVPGTEGEIWICCGSGGLYRSFNSGTSANLISSVAQAFHVGFGRAAQAGDHPAIYLFGVVDGALGFFRSDDAGSTWTRINDDSRQYGWVHQIAGDPRVYGRCYVAAEGRGIAYGDPQDTSARSDVISTFRLYAATDSVHHPSEAISVSWSSASDPLGKPLTYLMRFFGNGIDTTYLSHDTAASITVPGVQPSSTYTLTGQATNGLDTTGSTNALLFYSASLLTGIPSPAGIAPMRFALYQNYPNPFNPSTRISYSIPVSAQVTLTVYDIIGQEVAILVRNERQGAGRHDVSFDGSGLSSGVYYYRLRAAPYEATGEMVLLK